MSQVPHVYMRDLATDQWPWNQGSLVQLARWVPRGATVLELGPASGYFTRHLKEELDCVVDAIEVDPAMADRLRPWCRRLVVGDLETLDIEGALPRNAYRAIIVADVLEHLRDPLRLLIRLRDLLAGDGQILISVPNVAYVGLVADLVAGEFAYRDEGLLDRAHLRFFTRDSLAALLRDADLHPAAWSAVEMPLNESEFKTRLETLPRALRETLTASPQAFCYQWLVAAGAAAPATLPADVPACRRDRFPVRVFWLEPGSDWGYERSVVAWGEVGNERQTLRIALPRRVRAALRVCLADRPAFVRVHGARLMSSDGATRWSWRPTDGAPALARATYNAGVASDDDACHATLYDVESWLELACADVARPEDAGMLELELGWPMSPDFLAARRGWIAATAELRSEVERLGALVAERDRALAQRGAAPRVRPAVDVVVPVYNAPADVVRCVESVIVHTQGAYRLVLIDDASPDAAIRERFAELAARALPQLVLLRNERNLGFTGTANRGIALAGEAGADVVLLNSDTLVTAGWLDALVRCAASDPRIGTITPFSNNAEICSFPRFCENDAWPEGRDPEPVRAALAAAAVPSYPDLPTAVGFCMYVRRALIDAIGALDPAFGAGYGEENDFCLRAARAGWRNVLCDDAFVVHLGERSFAGRKAELGARNTALLRERHPSYVDLVGDYIAADPLRSIREAAITELSVRAASVPGVLHIVDARAQATVQRLRAQIGASEHGCRHCLARIAGDVWEIDDDRDEAGPATFAFVRQAGESCGEFVRALCATFGIGLVEVHEPLSDLEVREALGEIGLPFATAAPDADFAPPPADPPWGRPPFAPLGRARVRDALGYRPWTPQSRQPAAPCAAVPGSGTADVAGISATAVAATPPAIADTAAPPASESTTPPPSSGLASGAARIALRWRHTRAGRVLYGLTPPSIVAALKSRLR